MIISFKIISSFCYQLSLCDRFDTYDNTDVEDGRVREEGDAQLGLEGAACKRASQGRGKGEGIDDGKIAKHKDKKWLI